MSVPVVNKALPASVVTNTSLPVRLAAQQVPNQPITVVNSCVDPRGTTVANFIAAAGSGTVNQNPTNRADGYQQLATPKSCIEVIATPTTSTYVEILSNFKAQGQPIGVSPGQMVAVRAAGKAVAAAGTSWVLALWIQYYNSAGTFLTQYQIATSVNNPGTGIWVPLEGFDNQAPATVAYCEFAVQTFGTTAGSAVTLRATEFVVAIDPDGDVPGYVGGDATGGVWSGTADNSTSTVNFDSSTVYPAQDFGFNDYALSNEQTQFPYTSAQSIQLYRDIGANVARVSFGFSIGAGPGAPTLSAQTLAYLQALVAAGIKLVLNPAGFPAWMAPSHMPALAAAITTTTGTSITTAAAAPAKISMPFDILIDSERMTVTAGATTTTWTVTRGVSGTTAATHANAAPITDAVFNKAFGHLYYPDSGYRTTYGQAVVNLINTLGPTNIRGVLVWNEPNLFADDTRNEGAAGYTAFLNAVYTAVKAAYPNISILAGALSTAYAGTDANGSDAVTFLQGMYTAGANFDYLDHHPYPGLSAGLTGTTSDPGSTNAGFDRCLKRIRDAQIVQGDSRPIFVSEFGSISLKPTERTQQQAVALMFGRMRRDPTIVGVCHNGLAGIAGPNDTSIWDQTTLRPRPAARQIAKMRSRSPMPGQPALLPDSPVLPSFQPSDVGLLLSSIDPAIATGSIQLGSGTIIVAKLWVPKTVTITNLVAYVAVAGATLTAGQNLGGIYNAQGQLVAQTADQSTNWTSIAEKVMALTAQTGFSLTLPGGPGVFYWGALLGNGTTGPKVAATPVGMIQNPGFAVNVYSAAVPGARHRSAYESVGGRTSLVTLVNKSLTDNSLSQTIWLAVT